MKLYFIERNLFDVFFGDGFNNYLRMRLTSHGLVIYKRGGKLPDDYLNLVEIKLLLSRGV